jgi:ribosome-binding ATPase YchF (GTP1/OBG family)
MKTGIIGLPQVGKTSLFGILTKVRLSEQAYSNPREAHIGVAKVPDDRLDKLAALYNPKKLTHASVEYVDVGAIGQDALKETAYIGHLRQVDALIHVLRAFESDEIPHIGPIDPLRDIKNVEFDLMVSDLGQIEKRLERLEKDLKKMKTPELEKENELLIKAKAFLETEKPSPRNGDDSRRQKASARLHVFEREADALRSQHRREHRARQRPRSGGREI